MGDREGKLVRVIRLLELLRRRRRGVTLAEIRDDIGISKPTATRYVRALADAGVPLHKGRSGGEERWRITEDGGYRPSTAELFALASSRVLLQGLEGTRAVAWVERRLKASHPRITMDAPVHHDAGLARAVEQALVSERRLRVAYRGVKDDAARERVIEPLELRFSARAWYLFAADVEKGELRTFKLARVERATVLDEPIHTSRIDAEPDRSQVGVWQSAERYDVAIRIFPPGARFVAEYPLAASQRIAFEHDGSALVCAIVNGLEEVTRWVLRWGSVARVERPAALVRAVEAELDGARARYRAAARSTV